MALYCDFNRQDSQALQAAWAECGSIGDQSDRVESKLSLLPACSNVCT